MNNGVPQKILEMALQNPLVMQNETFANAVNLYKQGKNKELWELTNNLCRTCGTTAEEVRKRNGI